MNVGERGGLHHRDAALRRRGAVAARRGPAPARHRLLDLQRSGGNRAVVRLVQRDAPVPREQPPVKDVHGEAGWKALRGQAVTAMDERDPAARDLYAKLLSDAAATAGLGALAGFDPQRVHVVDGTAAPGLNLDLDPTAGPGQVGWVDKAGKFGVPLEFQKAIPDVAAGLKIGVQALKEDKALSIRVIRHEMVHVEHRLMTMEAVRAWHGAGRKGDFATWVDRNARGLKLADVDVVLGKKGAAGGWVDTEVLAYVEGFMTEFHRTPPTKDGPAFALFELLGAVETTKGYTWKQADATVKRTASDRLRRYHGTLDKAHRERWKAWVDEGVSKSSADRTGRKEFYAELATVVR